MHAGDSWRHWGDPSPGSSAGHAAIHASDYRGMFRHAFRLLCRGYNDLFI